MTVETVTADQGGNGTAPPSDLDLLRAEVANEAKPRDDLPEGAVSVPLHNRAGEVVAVFGVLHPDDWPSSANEDPQGQRLYTWALKVLATEEDRALWRALDPPNREVARFIDDWSAASGNKPGEGNASR